MRLPLISLGSLAAAVGSLVTLEEVYARDGAGIFSGLPLCVIEVRWHRDVCTMVGPDSSYSPLEIHICWKVLSEDRIEPPIHSEYLRSGVATTLIFIVDGARAVISFVMRSTMPSNRVVPPDARAAGFLAISLDTMLTTRSKVSTSSTSSFSLRGSQHVPCS